MRRMARPWLVSVSVKGLNIERFIRLAGERGIRLTSLRRPSVRSLQAMVEETRVADLQELALQGGWVLKRGARQGPGRVVEWLHRHWLMAAALMAAGMALLAVSQFVWRIDVYDGGVYEADIRKALSEMGIRPPILRSRIDIGELRSALEWRYPRIAWFECGWRGTALVVRPVEGTLPRMDGRADGSCDVVAARDGIVHTIITRAGTPVVKGGDIVRKGEVLIRGEERTAEGGVRPVAARGSVTARVWVGASAVIPAYETITDYTGSSDMVWTVRCPWFDLWPMKESSFVRYDTEIREMSFGGLFIPLSLHVETRMEAEYSRKRRDEDTLKEEAYAAALRKLHEKVTDQESLIDIWGNCSMINDEKVQSVAIGEMLVEIGMQSDSSGMAAPEQGSPG